MTLPIKTNQPGEPSTHYWNRMVCGDRAGLALRSDYREHLANAVEHCGFRSLRQHGMFHNDMFVWHQQDGPFNHQYLFSNYDYYQSIGIRPFVELSFMPTWMAANDNTVFAVNCAACPPKDYQNWFRLVNTTVKALVDRYGLDEVKSWHFEPWNEPDIAFFKGTQDEYFELYKVSCDAVKSVDSTLRIGGPATSNFVPDENGEYFPVWVEDFMEYCQNNSLPIDFISTHPYPTDFPFDEGSQTHVRVIRDENATYHDLMLLRELVNQSAFQNVEIHCNEWGSSPGNRDRTHDHVYSGTFLLSNLLKCDGLVDSLARWVFSDVSEEAPPGPSEFHGGWGLQTVHGIPKPGFHAYSFLNKLGGTKLFHDDGITVHRSAESVQVLLYNHAHYAKAEASWETLDGIEEMIGTHGQPRSFDLQLQEMKGRFRIRKSLVDRNHGWAIPAWIEMGQPDWPLPDQLSELQQAAKPYMTLQTVDSENNDISITETLPPHGMMLIEIEKV